MKENYEKIFQMDIMDKKRTARGIYNRASRKGYIKGGVKTQSDFLSNKEKKLLNGEIIVTNKYDDIKNLPTWQELKNMEHSSQKKILEIAKEKHKISTLKKHWNISSGALYNLLGKYNIRIGGSKVEKTNELPTFEEFEKMSNDQKKEALKNARRDFSISKIRRYWGISQSKIYKYLKEFDLVGSEQPLEEEKVAIEQNNTMEENSGSEAMQRLIKVVDELKEKLDFNISTEKEIKKCGFRIEFNGEHTKDEIESRILNLSQIMIDGKKYNINILLEEI